MFPAGRLLLDSITSAGSATNAGTYTSANIDTFDANGQPPRSIKIDIAATTQAASTQAGSPSLLKLQESDTTVASTFADVTGFRGGSATATNVDFVVGIGKTSGFNTYTMNVDARARKRYLNVVISPTTTQSFQVTANAFGFPQSPNTAAKAGVLSLIEG